MKIKNTKKKQNSPQSLTTLITQIKARTYNKNKKPFNFLLKSKINKIINNVLSPSEIKYKDQNFFITNEEFMNRYYTISESEIRLSNYIEFYQNLDNYYQFNYEIYNQRRIMYKNQKRKYKLENRKNQKKKKTKKNKRKNMLGKLKDSTVYLDEVKSNNSGNYEKKKWENISENFELNLPEYNDSGYLHDIYNPSFSSSQSFLSENKKERKKSVSDFCLRSLQNDNSSIESIIAEISKLDNIEESRIRKNSVEPSQIDIGVFNLFPDLNNEYEKKNFDVGKKNFKRDLVLEDDFDFEKNLNLKKAFNVKEEDFELFHFDSGHNNKIIKNFERRRVNKKNSIKNSSLVDKNTLESKFSTDNKIKVKKVRKLNKKNKMNFINKKLKVNKNTLINKKQHFSKRKLKDAILRTKNLKAKILVNNFNKSNSKLSNKSRKSSNYKLLSKKSLKNNIKKSKFRKNEYDYNFVEKKLFSLKKEDLRKNTIKIKNQMINSKKISFKDLSRNLSNQKLNSSITKKFFDKDNHKQRKKLKIKESYRKKEFSNKKIKKSPRNSKLANNRSRSLKRDYDEYDYYKQKKDLLNLGKKKNKSSDRKILKKNHVFVKQRISLQNLKGKEKELLKLIPKKAKVRN